MRKVSDATVCPPIHVRHKNQRTRHFILGVISMAINFWRLSKTKSPEILRAQYRVGKPLSKIDFRSRGAEADMN